MAYLELKHVTYCYPEGYTAVRDLSLSFEKGEKAAIIGQNGAGKTTTLKLMNGLLKPTSGKVLVDGESTENHTTAQISAKVGYVFQNPDDQIFQASIYDEIAFGLKKKGLSKEELQKRVTEAAGLCGLGDFLSEHPYNLSYSKRKFITMAAVIAMDPTVILLDEPTAGQDRESTELLGRIIDELILHNKTVITITHDMEFAVREFQRVIVMAQSEKQKDSNPMEIFQDEELLKISSLKQPYICRLAGLLGYRNVLNIHDLLRYDLTN